ncbi:MAG: ASCH domain-containing protein [Bacilli bacterium]
MLLFKTYHIDAILSGVKTQTRRAWKRPRVRVGAVHQAKTNYYRAGCFGWIRITGLRRERLGAISEADARAEGDYSIEEYRRVWEEINGAWTPDLEVWVVDFEIVEQNRNP